MIKIEHVVLASPEQMDFIVEGMRNAKNSWDKCSLATDIQSSLEKRIFSNLHPYV